jgi:hypothetical protein
MTGVMNICMDGCSFKVSAEGVLHFFHIPTHASTFLGDASFTAHDLWVYEFWGPYIVLNMYDQMVQWSWLLGFMTWWVIPHAPKPACDM